ncbi:SUF system Fe-S cluster assembly protein [Nitrospirillum sp. BR 11752]|uniref:SUF system Fe-S cluster assembly protein n=1 Tax=Nitrospirillum sp. BR 11752 TaxID=3104293 RepID=UPI002EA0E012|nr:SUF system Fe-S cluster assembly protein [Nitrospirillum sp. BR 11752]
MSGAERPIAPDVTLQAPATIPDEDKLPPDAPLADRVTEALRTVYDPEIPVNIYELGLIYRCDIDADGLVEIDMTLTAPGCPVAGEMPGQVQGVVASVDGVKDVTVNLVWEPAWNPSLMSDEARVALNMF